MTRIVKDVTEITTDRPQNPETVAAAAQSVSALMQYLASATAPGTAEVTLPNPSHVHQVVQALAATVAGLDPVLANLATTTERHASDPTLRDDRGGTGDGTAAATVAALRDAGQALHRLKRRLAEASGTSGHLVDSH